MSNLFDYSSGSYRQYKEDTNAFITWLVHTARACGYKSEAKPEPADEEQKAKTELTATAQPRRTSTRLKGKARKLAQEAAAKENPGTARSAPPTPQVSVKTIKYKITSLELLQQASAVANAKDSAATRMPGSIKSVLLRAIKTRKRYSAWFETAKKMDDNDNRDYAVDGHQLFIEKLEEAYAMLAPAQEENDGEGTDANSAGVPKPAYTFSSSSTLPLENRFSSLEVEEPSADVNIGPTDDAALATTEKNEDPATTDIFELQMDAVYEHPFVLYCFVEDLHHIRDEIRLIWQSYKAGIVNLMTATLFTQAALYMAHRSETQIAHAVFANESDYFPYMRLIDIFYRSKEIRNLVPSPDLSNPNWTTAEYSQFEHFVFMPVARVLLKFFSQPTSILWPCPVPSIRISYIHNPDALKRRDHAQIDREDTLLTQFLHDFAFIDYWYNNKDLDHRPQGVEDCLDYANDNIFTKFVRPAGEDTMINITAVFASRVFLDVVDICDGNPSHCNAFIEARDRHQKDFAFKPPLGSSGGGPLGPGLDTEFIRWHAISNPKLYEAYKLIHVDCTTGADAFEQCRRFTLRCQREIPAHIFPTEDNLSVMKAGVEDQGFILEYMPTCELQAAMQSLHPLYIDPAKEGDILFRRNPLFSGNKMIKMATTSQQAGIDLANYHMTIFACAHLYNALRQLGMLDTTWPIMERVIAIHKKPIFAGVLPTTQDQIADRLAYRLNARRTQSEQRFLKKKAWLLQISAASVVIQGFADDNMTIESVLARLEAYMNYNRHGKQSSRSQSPTCQQTLARWRQCLPGMVDNAVALNYIQLTKKCLIILRQLRIRLNETIMAENLPIPFYPEEHVPKDPDFRLLYIVEDTLNEAKDVYRNYNHDPRVRELSPHRNGFRMRVAAQMFHDTLAKLG